MNGRVQALSVVLVATLAGCGTSQVNPEHAKSVPADRVYGFSKKTTSDDSSIKVVRDKGLYGSGCGLVVRLDGERAATLNAGEVVSFYIPPGEHTITTGLSGQGLCSLLVDKSIEFVSKPNQQRVYRLSLDQGGFYINPYVE